MSFIYEYNKIGGVNSSSKTTELRLTSGTIAVFLGATIILTASLASVFSSSNNENRQTETEDDEIIESNIYINWFLQRHRNLMEEDHKPLFPLSGKDYGGFFCATLGLMLAAGGGIGGGGMLVPIYILVMEFTPKHSIPLSNITVFGGSLANVYLNASKRHPLADRPLVDWDLILMMEPLTIAGALVGAVLNKLLDEMVLVVMLVLLLSYTSYNTLKRAVKMYNAENEQRRIEVDDIFLDDVGHFTNAVYHDVGDQPSTLKTILENERSVPMGNITLLVIMFIVVLFINVMKGGGAFPSPVGIKCGSALYWAANVLNLLWIISISFIARHHLLKKYELKESCGYQYVEGDIKWTPRATIRYPIICTFAGFFAGMFGVGGGIVKGPLMLAMGVHPQVSSASSACMILFTSFTATTSFVVFGLLIPDYAALCLIVGFVSTFLGQVAVNYLIRRLQRDSLIAFSVGGVVLLSAFLMTIQSVVGVDDGVEAIEGICKIDN